MSALMSIGRTALSASYAALQTTSNNIANANTPGYSRQGVVVAENPGQYTGSGFLGKGVAVKTVSRAYDGLLTQQANATASTAASDAARLDQLKQLETVFPVGSAGLGAAAGSLVNSFVDVSNTPADSSARQVVLGQAQEFAARARSAADQLSALQGGVTQTVRTQVDELNGYATQVAALNGQISAARGTGQPPNALLDQRDALVGKISQLADVKAIAADDGSVGLFIAGGQTLVLGNSASAVKTTQDAFDPAKVSLAVQQGESLRPIATSAVTGGSIAGLLRFQDHDLAAANQLLGQITTATAGALNRQQSLGLALGSPPAAGAPMFATGAPRVLPASDNRGGAALSISVADPSQAQASDYSVAFDGSRYSLTRTSDNQPVAGSPFDAAAVASGVTFEGVTLRASGAPASGDRFLLQPVSTAAQSVAATLGDPSGIAAASPFIASTGTGNTGSATVASMRAVASGYDASRSTAITFTDAQGGYSWSGSDGSSGSGTWSAGQPITLNGSALSLNGVPRPGDTFAIVPTASPATSNGNALAFAALGDQPFVATSRGGSQTVTDAYASALANIGVRVQSGTTAATISGAAASSAESTRANSAGVNLDEEASKLIQYQQSYQAAAKVLQVAQQIFESTLQMVGG